MSRCPPRLGATNVGRTGGNADKGRLSSWPLPRKGRLDAVGWLADTLLGATRAEYSFSPGIIARPFGSSMMYARAPSRLSF